MANEWREMALTMPDTLLEACPSEETVRLIHLAIIKLEGQHEALRAKRVGVADGYVEPAPGVSPLTLLEDARRDIKRCSTLHGLANNVLPLSCEGMDLVLSADMAQSWYKHSNDALRNTDDAQMRLCGAASIAKAAYDAVDLAAELPAGDIIQIAWLLAAEQLLNKALNEVYRARNQVRKMQDDLSLLFFDAWSFLRLAQALAAEENNQMDP